MAALAHRDGQAQEGLGQSASSRARRAPVRRTRARGSARSELECPRPKSSFPSLPRLRGPGTIEVSAPRSGPTLPDRACSAHKSRPRLEPGATRCALTKRRFRGEPYLSPPTGLVLPGQKTTRPPPKRGASRPRSRGLRRLLPGAATLAVLASVWFGAGALSTVHRPAMAVPAAAVRVHGGYLYVARPGDTLWSIASALQPGGDPRPIVAELEQQLHGAQLVAGDRLTLP